MPETVLRPGTVILSSNNDPLYAGLLEIVSAAWNACGIRVLHGKMGDRDTDPYPTRYGIEVGIATVSGVQPSTQSQLARFYAAKFATGFVMFSDIDMLPINPDYFKFPAVAASGFACVRPVHGSRPVSMCYLCGDAKLLSDALGATVKTFAGFCETVLETVGDTWTSDELYAVKRLTRSPSWKGVFQLPGTRICRNDWKYDASLLARRRYVDAHLLRPYAAHRQAIDAVLAKLNLRP